MALYVSLLRWDSDNTNVFCRFVVAVACIVQCPHGQVSLDFLTMIILVTDLYEASCFSISGTWERQRFN